MSGPPVRRRVPLPEPSPSGQRFCATHSPHPAEKTTQKDSVPGLLCDTFCVVRLPWPGLCPSIPRSRASALCPGQHSSHPKETAAVLGNVPSPSPRGPGTVSKARPAPHVHSPLTFLCPLRPPHKSTGATRPSLALWSGPVGPPGPRVNGDHDGGAGWPAVGARHAVGTTWSRQAPPRRPQAPGPA